MESEVPGKGAGTPVGVSGPAGVAGGAAPPPPPAAERFTISRSAAERIRGEFMAVLRKASPSQWQPDLFDTEVERWLLREVQRKLFEPRVRNGGKYERFVSERLEEISKNRGYGDRMRKIAYFASLAWRKVLPPENPRAASGHYYCRKAMSAKDQTRTAPSSDDCQSDYRLFQELRHRGAEEGNEELRWFGELMLGGKPEAIGDFRLDPLFLVLLPDGTTSRMVRLRNVAGEERSPIMLDADGFHSSQEFRRWLLRQGNFTWEGNQGEADALHEDVSRALAFTEVKMITEFGWHALNTKRGAEKPAGPILDGVWFYGDCAYRNGKRLQPDARGAYWLDGVGYEPSKEPREGRYFMGLPRLEPDTRLRDAVLELGAGSGEQGAEERKKEEGRRKKENAEAEAAEERRLLRGLWMELNRRLKETMGSDDAKTVIGAFVGYAAGPEIYAWRNAFPGLWLHGQRGSGKSTIARDLMRIWGFSLDAGLELKEGNNVTATGMAMALDQYSNLPVWADEWRRNVTKPDKTDMIHAAFNRGTAAKYGPGGVQRQIRTVWIVSGESTTGDSALRTRYPHIHVSARAREELAKQGVNHLEWFLRHREHFHHFGKFLMENRAEFVELVLELLRAYVADPEVGDDRIKLVNGVSFSAWTALNTMLEGEPVAVMAAFRKHSIEAMKNTEIETDEDLNINKFWTYLVVAFQAGEIPIEAFRVDVEMSKPNTEPGHPDRLWKRYLLYFQPDPVLSALQMWLVKQHETLPLGRSDLQKQLSVTPYWLQGKHTKRFPGAGITAKCWGIVMDEHPLGRQEVSDEEWAEYNRLRLAPQDGSIPSDPREGELFCIVNKVIKKEG